MQKFTSLPPLEPPKPRRHRITTIPAIAAGLAISPIVYESGLICAANWRAMQGHDGYVETPVLDAVGLRLAEVTEWASASVGSYFHSIPWRPEVVLAFGFAWVGIGAMMLRSRLR